MLKDFPAPKESNVCLICNGTGWKPASNNRVTRCDCRMQSRTQSLLASARIPKRYEHCELSNFEFDGPYAHLMRARMEACKFVEQYPLDNTGLLLTGTLGTGKTHLAVGIIKELMRSKGTSCLFCDYRELLKTIQDSYNPSVRATEMGILRPVFDAEILLIDDLGAVIPSEWIFDTVALIINTRYNSQKTVIVTTNFPNVPSAAPSSRPGEEIDMFKTKAQSKVKVEAEAATRGYTLGDRITERMRSRLHEMCRIVRMEGQDFRQTLRSASFR